MRRARSPHRRFGAALVALALGLLTAAAAQAAEAQTVAYVGHAAVRPGLEAHAVAGNRAYVLGSGQTGQHRGAALHVVDLADPTRPAVLGGVDVSGYGNSFLGVAAQGTHAYATIGPGVYDPGRLIAVDASDPANPRAVADVATSRGSPRRPVIVGRYLYLLVSVFRGSSALDVYDLADPALPVRVAALQLPFAGEPSATWDLAVDGGSAYVADTGTGLVVVDVSDPARPAVLGRYQPPGAAQAVAASGRHAYLVTADQGERATLRVVDVADPANPRAVGAAALPSGTDGSVRRVAADGGRVVVAVPGAGLRVYDVSDPTRPTEVAGSAVPESPGQPVVADGRLHLIDGAGVFWVLRAPVAAVAATELLPQSYLPVVPQSGDWAGVRGRAFAASVAVLNRGRATARAALWVRREDGAAAAEPLEYRIAPGASQLVYLPALAGLPAGRYALVVAADEPVSAQANLSGAGPVATGYAGVPPGEAQGVLYAPGVFKRYVGVYSSSLSLQNPGGQPARATVTYRDPEGARVAAEARTVPAFGAVDLALEEAALPDGFVGSATVSADRPLVGLVHALGQPAELATARLLRWPDSFFGPALPAVYKHYSPDGWISSVLVQNVGATPATITLVFRPHATTGEIAFTDTIPAFGMRQYWQGSRPADLPDGFAGSVTFQTPLGTERVVAQVNTRNAAGNLSGYEGLHPAFGSPLGAPLYFPALYAGYSPLDWVSSFVLQNVSDGRAEVEVAYYDAGGLVRSTTVALAAYEARLFYQPSEREGLPVGFRGSAVVRGTSGRGTSRVVGVANVLARGQSDGDRLLSYEGFSTSP